MFQIPVSLPATSPMHDSAGCSGILPWTYYVNDPSGLVLAVYHGRQMKRSQLGAGCPDPPTPPTQSTRRVFMYPVEYRAYGPDGINVVYERENYGVNAGQWVKRYLTTDYQGSVLQAHDASGDHEQHYELFGAEKGQVARRTGWLDREIDWETSPLSDLYRTVDLVNRKYDPQRATFLTSDPLWMMSDDASSYHYGYHDPMNMNDPWGLDPDESKGVTDGGKDGDGSGGKDRDDTPQDDAEYEDGVMIRGTCVMVHVGLSAFSEVDAANASRATLESWGKRAHSVKVENEVVGGKLNDPVRILQGPKDRAQNNWKGIPYLPPAPTDGRPNTWDPVTDRRINQLDPRVQQPARDFINATEAELGVTLRVTDGYRSIAEQNNLYALGRTKPDKKVTNLKGGQSNHQFGLAIDVAEMKNRKLTGRAITMQIALIGMRYGFRWGGLWSKFKDYPHFEMLFRQ